MSTVQQASVAGENYVVEPNELRALYFEVLEERRKFINRWSPGPAITIAHDIYIKKLEKRFSCHLN